MRKIIIVILILCAFLVSFFYFKKIVLSQKEITLKANSIFLGQLYPSGHVYLKASKAGLKNWPRSVYLLGLAINGDISPQTAVSYVRTLEATQNEEASPTLMAIPYLEQMDDDHLDCGLGKIAKSPNYKYLGVEKEADKIDLFETVFDHCAPPADTALYQAKVKGNFSYLTLGFSEKLKQSSVTWLNRAPKKLTAQDLDQISRQKAKDRIYFKKENIECTTNPAYLDSALNLYEIRFHESAVTMLLSSYQDPGCTGHLSYIYILDVFQEGQFLKRFKFTNYFGGI